VQKIGAHLNQVPCFLACYTRFVDVFTKIKDVKSKAYKGAVGARRERFCSEYSELLKTTRAHIHENANNLKDGEIISCHQGCSFCCYQHVGVMFAHGLLVVDYLYSHDQALSNFINNYARWHENLGDISDDIDYAFRLAVRNPDPHELLSVVKSPLFQNYHNKQVPCPFLQNAKCSIYEVRPSSCAQHISTSPNEWCSKNSKFKPVTREIPISASDTAKLKSLPYVSPSLLLLIFTLPTVTYKLLLNGLPHFLIEMKIEPIFV
jgi:Fe-S-cluster containining protein